MSPPFFTSFFLPISFILLTVTADYETNDPTALSRGKKLGEITTAAKVIIKGGDKIYSEKRIFVLGFFPVNDESEWYLGIWYFGIPTPTYVWVANREKPNRNLSSSVLEIGDNGRLAVKESGTLLWQSDNTGSSTNVSLLDNGNLILVSQNGSVQWQSFDYPADTWLPGMILTSKKWLTSWRSLSDPSPGLYSLRIRGPDYGELQLVYNGSQGYWSTGNWTGHAFVNVPEMTVRYIYSFNFTDPFTPQAAFWYTETAMESGSKPPLTRFQLDSLGEIRQYTWWTQTQSWNTFWRQPDDFCKVYGLCGDFGFCNGEPLKPCECLSGFRPVDDRGWGSGDYSGGCRRQGDSVCHVSDGFQEVGSGSFNGAEFDLFSGRRGDCETLCLSNCSCIGLYHNEKTNLWKNLYGSLLNFRNLTSDSTYGGVLYVRVQKEGIVKKKNNFRTVTLVASIVGSIVILGLVVMLMVLRYRKEQDRVEEINFPVMNLKVFTYKELRGATRDFSEKLGHGGFGTVFHGELSDSSLVAVKRLERQGGGEKEFRAEVGTIGNIQHVNLVRLRGFCSENSERLLVYDYMPNGPLSGYLRQGGQNLCWDVRFRIAIGTARGIAYLHEACRYCIIHCDIKPENILLDSEYTAKVSDFGLAKLLGRDFSRVLATMRGTWGYVAPEWISGLEITVKADVYSYGMTLLELIGGRRNVEAPPSAASADAGGEVERGEKWFFPPWAAHHIIKGDVTAVVDCRLGNAYNIEEAKRVAYIAIWCIQDEEEMRPTMGMIVKMLEGTVPVAVPPPPKLLQALVSGESFRGVEGKFNSRNEISTNSGCSGDNLGMISASDNVSFKSNINFETYKFDVVTEANPV